MSRWRDVVREELARYREQTGLAVVERQELLDQSLPRLQAEFPDSDTHGQSLSRTLRELRDRGEIRHLSRGTDRILSLDCDGVPAPDPPTPDAAPTYTATEYETTATGRRVHAEFRDAVLDRYGNCCPVSGVDHVGLLDVAHVLPWSEFPDRRADFDNVLALDKTHHAAFDRGLFTLDADHRLRLNPGFETDSDVLRRTLTDGAGQRVGFTDGTGPSPEYLRKRNERLDWSPT